MPSGVPCPDLDLSSLIWRCPACRGELVDVKTALKCAGCITTYEVVDGIPDLRHPAVRDAAARSDLAEARATAAQAGGKAAAELVRAFFAVREGFDGWTHHDTEARTRQSLLAPARLRMEVDGWLDRVTGRASFLDLGCGLGGFLSAASAAGRRGIGIDNRMSVLVVAKRLIEQRGGTATLACANAEAIPLADESLGGVVMYDVVEHVTHLENVLSEVSRVTETGGALGCSTPNRFSLAPEPHVHVWGVGWLPRRYQDAYVKFSNGRDYAGTRLLSAAELGRMVRRYTRFDAMLIVPPIPAAEIASWKGMRRVVARVYNAVAGMALVRPVLLRIGPFFQFVGVKRAPPRP